MFLSMELIIAWTSYLLIGGLAGFLAGLLGIGGGLVIVPALILIFQFQHFSSSILTHLAVGTSLATIIVTAAKSTWEHHLHRAISWQIVKFLGFSILLGTLVGGVIVDHLTGKTLQLIIGLFSCVVAFQMFLSKDIRATTTTIFKRYELLVAGVSIGTASSIFGIGGGSFIVPYLTWRHVSAHQAIATSAACGFVIAVGATLSYIIMGVNESQLPSWTTGYVYWPAFLGIVATSVWTARWGVILSYRLPALLLKRIFASLLILIGLNFVVRNLSF